MQLLLAVVDLGRIRKNAALVAARAKKPLIAVVKDDAYGHGAEQIAHALSDMVCAFAVSTVEEGVRLRVAGVGGDILVMTPPLCRAEAERSAAYCLTATLSSRRALTLMEGIGGAKAHLAVNTGMNRYGVRPERVRALCRGAIAAGIEVSGVFSHLYDPADDGAFEAQRECFSRAADDVKAYFPEAVAHLSATGGILRGDTFDAVRAGLSLYGYLPEGFEGLPVKPALKIYATVAESRVRSGGGAGYGRAPEGAVKLHTLRLGYGDGFFREGGLGAVGKLCMDACVREGFAPVGSRRLVLKDAAAYAREHGTTAYEVLVNVTKRAEIKYIF